MTSGTNVLAVGTARAATTTTSDNISSGNNHLSSFRQPADIILSVPPSFPSRIERIDQKSCSYNRLELACL
jgi:hypothetical protein